MQPGIQQRVPTPAEREDLGKLLPRYEAALVPASRDAVQESVTMLAMAYPAARVSIDDLEARLEVYTAGLADLPPDILNIACQSAVKELTFFPTVAEIRARAHGFAQRQWRMMRVKELIARYDRERAEDDAAPRATPEEIARIIKETGLNMEGLGQAKRATPEWIREAMAAAEAEGIEARRAETAETDSVHESPVPKGAATNASNSKEFAA